MRPLRTTRSCGTILLLALLAACDGTGPVEVGSIAIASVATELAAGSSVQLSATVLSRSGSVLSGHPVTWTSTNETVASVSPGGRVTGVGVGTATISASSGGRSASVGFTVLPPQCTTADAVRSIAVGQTASGTLGAGACGLWWGQGSEGWQITLSSDTAIEVVMTSGHFPPTLVLTDLFMSPWAWGQEDGNSSTMRAQLAAGTYIIWASSYQHGATGTYQLSVSALQVCNTTSAAAALRLGDSLSGNLADGGCVLYQEIPAVGYRLDLAGTTGLRIEVTAHQFEPLLIITDMNMEPRWWNVGGNTAVLERRIPAGEYIVWVATWGQAVGSFQLSASEIDTPLCPPVGSLVPGGTVTGVLTPARCMRDDHWNSDVWTLTIPSQATLRIDLVSQQFDAVLVLEDEHGAELAWDDDGGSGTNSRLTHAFVPGEYRVVVTTFYPGATGGYQLSAQAVAGAEMAGLRLSPAAPPIPSGGRPKR